MWWEIQKAILFNMLSSLGVQDKDLCAALRTLLAIISAMQAVLVVKLLGLQYGVHSGVGGALPYLA